MRALILATGLAWPAVAAAQPATRWTFGPTVSGGGEWLSGHYDIVRDDPPPSCGPFCVSPLALPNSHWAPTFSVGVLATRRLTSRLDWTVATAFHVGPTHRFVDDNPYDGFVVGRDDRGVIAVYGPHARVGVRFASTLRLRLGTSMRGFLGAGLAIGWVGDADRRVDVLLPIAIGPDPTVQTPPLSRTTYAATLGATAEAVLEGGVFVGSRRRVALSLQVAAGRPRIRSELVLAFPFALGGWAESTERDAEAAADD